MLYKCLFSVLILLNICISKINACKGCVGLDESSFEKIIPRFKVVLVKFDVAFPYGEKHEEFTKLAAEVADNKDILLAEVGVKDYGEKENEELAKRHGVTKNDYPSIKLFKNDGSKPLSFHKSSEFTLDNLRTFVRDNTDIYLGLPGCIEEYDKLASKFVESNNKQSILNEVQKLKESLTLKEQDSAKVYIVVMKKIMETGKDFIKQETERVGKLLKGKLSSKKQTELENRLNILRAFTSPKKDEL